MNCDDIEKQLHAYFDDECEFFNELSVHSHLSHCGHCQSEIDRLQSLRSSLKQIARLQPPQHLPTSICHALIYHGPTKHSLNKDKQTAAGEMIEQPCLSLRRAGRAIRELLIAVKLKLTKAFKPAITHTAALCIGGLLVYHALNIQPATVASQESVVSAHVKSLMREPLTQVTSSDKHTVGPWFSGKIDFAPRVLDLASTGFPLIGGRIDYFDNRKYAVLVYSRRKHTINVFITPSPQGSSYHEYGRQQWNRRGFNLYRWYDRDMNYTAVSDLSANELELFSTYYQE